MLVDTHCHIHEADFPLSVNEVLQRAKEADVQKLICVGTNEKSSKDALAFATMHDNIFASIGVHPHDTKDGYEKIANLAKPGSLGEVLSKQASARHVEPRDASLVAAELAGAQTPSPRQEPSRGSTGHLNNVSTKTTPNDPAHAGRKLVAVGEVGLDYFYTHSPREVQIKALEAQIQVALDHNLPIIFHVREAFEDFWPIFDNFHGITGELHSFTDTKANLEEGLKRGLFIGINGISTFTKDPFQQQMFTSVPLERMLLETDAPFLTPVPKRGKVNEPAFVRLVAEFNANKRDISLQILAEATTANATKLFGV